MRNAFFLELEPIIVNGILDTHVMQSISIKANHFNSIKLSFTIAGDTSYTFFDAEEIMSTNFWKEMVMRERDRTFILENKTNDISADFGPKAVFDGTRIVASVEIEPTSNIAFHQEINLTRKMIALIILMVVLLSRNSFTTPLIYSMIVILFFSYEFSRGQPEVSTSSFAIYHYPYHFPLKYSLFFSKPTEVAANKIIAKANRNESNFQKCTRCRLNFVKTKSNSSPRDLIVSVAFQKVLNLNEYVRTIRSTGCRAQIAIFTDVEATKEIEEDCDVTYIPIGYDYEFWKKNRYISVNGMRAKLISHLLNLILNGIINRVLHADLFDTVFQGDPFIESFTNNTYILSNEGKLVGESGFNKVFCNDGVLGFPFSTMGKMPIYCAGLFAGGFEPVRFLYNTMSNWFTYRIEDTNFNDQHYYYMLVVTPFFRNLWDLVDSVSGDCFTSLAIFANEYSHEFPTQRKGFEYTPIVVHQMNRKALIPYKELVTSQCS